jgi:hypothetical protein
MKLSWKLGSALLVAFLVQVTLGVCQLTANSSSAEKCTNDGSGGCTNNGCGGVCGQPLVELEDGTTVSTDTCWCI